MRAMLVLIATIDQYLFDWLSQSRAGFKLVELLKKLIGNGFGGFDFHGVERSAYIIDEIT